MRDYTRYIFALTVAAIGIYGLYLGKVEVATGALGICGAILTPHINNGGNNEKTVDPAPPTS